MRILTDTEKQWLFDKSALEHTPSRIAGIPLKEELERRKTVISYVESLLFRATFDPNTHVYTSSKNVLYTAATLIHRFYMRRSIDDFKEKLMAPTMLFLASKIEEEPLKLRYIVNTCLSKWCPGAILWEPDRGSKDQSRDYQAWEREILAAEEMALDALCFDMNVDQPRKVLQHGLQSLKGVEGMNLEEIGGIAMLLLDYSKYTPLCVQYHPCVVALGIFAISIALRGQTTISEGFAAAAELGEQFDVDVEFTYEGIQGDEAEQVKAFYDDFCEYGKMGLVQAEMLQWIKPESEAATRYQRKFSSLPANGRETTTEEDLKVHAAETSVSVSAEGADT